MSITIGGVDYERKTVPLNFTFGATGTEKTISFTGVGKIHSYYMETPDFTNNSTSTLSIVNDEGMEIFSSGAKAESGAYNAAVNRIIEEDSTATLKVTLSTDAGGTGGTVIVQLFMDFDLRRPIY